MEHGSLDLGEPQPKKRGRGLLIFLIGLVVGSAGTILSPRYLGPLLPEGLRGGSEIVEGVVRAKRIEDERLLLTVEATQGATLVTFRDRVAEIDLLVDVGDTVTLAAPGYAPFIEDPRLTGVQKGISGGDDGSAGDPAGEPGDGGAPEEPASTEDTVAALSTEGSTSAGGTVTGATGASATETESPPDRTP